MSSNSCLGVSIDKIMALPISGILSCFGLIVNMILSEVVSDSVADKSPILNGIVSAITKRLDFDNGEC